MATISLYAGKINNMPGLIKGARDAVTDYKLELLNLRVKSLQVNQSICNLDDVISDISTSTQIQEEKVKSLETFYDNSEQFITDTVKTDGDVADIINQRKDDFYNKYDYLKPECEKSGWEKFCDGCKKVGEWCKDNWKSIVKIIASVLIIAALGIASILTGGALAVILAGAFWGALIGGALGGIMGGITSLISGGSFLEGFADGMLSGTISGAITGAATAGLGLAGQIAGKGIKCLSNLGKAIKITSKVTNVLSDCMDGFDTLTMVISLFDPNNPLVKFNQMLQSSVAYNIFQTGVGLLATFTGGATTTMKCFVAGTMVLTATGLVAIENIKAGDKVISTNAETFEVTEKTVLETYVRETTELVQLTINGETIKTTPDHPFYVKDVGFVGAGELYIGDKLLDSKGNILLIEDMKLETTEIPTPVYNFQVEDFHTYHVGENGIWVHNAEYSHTAFKQTEFNSSYESRIKSTPAETNNRVMFENKDLRGESKCILKPPPDAKLKSIMDDAGIDGIEYKNGVPDFSPVSKIELDGIDMTQGRKGPNGTYTQANTKVADMLNASPELADSWGIKPKNGETFVANDVKKYMEKNKLTWHELNDLTTVQMVPTEINGAFRHLGGIAEAGK